MDMLFIKVLNMSISASWLVLVILALRFLLKKSPRWVHVALWALVAVRLVCPISFESVLSLIPSTQTVPEEIFYMEAGQQHQPDSLEIVEARPNVESVDVELDMTVGNAQTRHVQWVFLWPAGMAVLLLYALASYLRLKRKVSACIQLDNGVRICDYIDTPFILGIISPRIYLPSSMEPDSASHVLAHERAHIARKDHWWKPLGYLLLTVHWFNPLLWLAYILLCRDIELACDEKVIRDMESHQKKAYSEVLLRCSVNRRMIAACPLAFGEVGVKERVKTVLNYKKPAFWIVLVAILALIVTAVCFLTDPVKEEDTTYRVEEVVYRNPMLSYYMTEEEAPLFQITGDNTLRSKEKDEEWVDLGEFSEIQLSDLNFDTLFFGMEMGVPWDDNQEAWILAVPPTEERNSTAFYLFWKQSGGIYLGEGIAFTSVYPLHENILDATLSVNWLYKLVETDSAQVGENVSPYEWTSTVEPWDIQRVLAYPYGDDSYLHTIEGSRLNELLLLLNEVKESEIVARKPSGMDDPLWNLDGTKMWLDCVNNMSVLLRYVDNTAIISTTTDSDVWKVDGYWVIENEALKDWLQNLAHGGTWMLSDENRDEIRRLLRQENVQFFDPQEYDDLLFVGCAYDNGRGLGVACFEKQANGYKLVRLIRDEDVKRCASGSELYYCDHGNRRVFLVMNQNVTAMEFAGAYEAQYAIDTHPGLVAAYYPGHSASMYRFVYGEGNSATMYMDWNNRTHGQVPDYAVDTFENPDDAYSICSRLKPEQVYVAYATEVVDVDERQSQAYAYAFTNEEMMQLLELLNGLPEDAYEPAEYPEKVIRDVDILFKHFTGTEEASPYLELGLYEGAVYCRFAYGLAQPYQTWKIDAPQLTEYLESIFAGDVSTWDRFSPFVRTDGEVIWSVDEVEMIIPKVNCFEFDMSEEGIRFKPESEDGWVLLQYRTEPYTPDELGLRRFNGKISGRDVVHGCYGDLAEWDFMEITITSGDAVFNVLMLNEDSAAWVAEYDSEINTIIRDLHLGISQSWQSAAYEHSYVNMRLSLPESWEYEIIEYADDKMPFGIRFRPAEEEDWMFLQFWPSGLNQQSTGVNSVGNQSLLFYYYEGQNIWRYATFQNQPCGYRIDNGAKDSWYREYEEQIGAILSSLVVAEGCIDEAEAKQLALEYVWENQLLTIYYGGEQPYEYATGFNFDTGGWTVSITDTRKGETVTCYLSLQGVVQAVTTD